LKRLEIAGLDELRMHPDILNNKDWDKMKLLYVNGKENTNMASALRFHQFHVMKKRP